jgi:hypothetical protein
MNSDPWLNESLADLRAANCLSGIRERSSSLHCLSDGARLLVQAPSTGALTENTRDICSAMSDCWYWFVTAEPSCLLSTLTRLDLPNPALVTRHLVYPVADACVSPPTDREHAWLAEAAHPVRLADPQARLPIAVFE